MSKENQIKEIIFTQLNDYLGETFELSDSFFSIGADSVLIVRLRQEIEDRCQVDVSIEDFVNGRIVTIEDLFLLVGSNMVLDAPLPVDAGFNGESTSLVL